MSQNHYNIQDYEEFMRRAKALAEWFEQMAELSKKWNTPGEKKNENILP